MRKDLAKFYELRPEFTPSLFKPTLYFDCQIDESTFIQIWASQDRIYFWEPIRLQMRVVQGWNTLVKEDICLESAEEANTEVVRFLFDNGGSFELSVIKHVNSDTNS